MFKQKIYLGFISFLLLTGCQSQASASDSETITGDYRNLSIVSPTGAPAVAFYDFASSSNYETNSTPSNIVSMMTQSGKDIVVIDTVSGLKAMENGAPYKMLATITFGNFYLAATGNDDDQTLNDGDDVILFGQNQTADLLFNYVYADYKDRLNIEYVTAVTDAAKCLASGKNGDLSKEVDYVLVAQPVLYAQLNNQSAATYGKASVYADIQELYNQKSGGKKLTQASVFVKTTDSSEQFQKDVEHFSQKLKSDIETAIADPQKVLDGFNKITAEEATAKFGISGAVAKNVLANNNGLGLGYVLASEEIGDVNDYIALVSTVGAIDQSHCYA